MVMVVVVMMMMRMVLEVWSVAHHADHAKHEYYHCDNLNSPPECFGGRLMLVLWTVLAAVVEYQRRNPCHETQRFDAEVFLRLELLHLGLSVRCA